MAQQQSPRRRFTLCSSSFPLCPGCGRPIRRIHAGQGTAFARCEQRLRTGEPCGQHVLLIGVWAGVCNIVPLTREEFERYREDPRDPRAILYELGVLTGDGRSLTAREA